MALKMPRYNLLIVGGGISGAALAYAASRFTNASVGLVEAYPRLAPLASAGSSNSQTIHDGSIETNYQLAKAIETHAKAEMIERYCLQHGHDAQSGFMRRGQKMALGVGENEVEYMLDRHKNFQPHFPGLEIFDKAELSRIEPKVVYDANGRKRKEELVGVGIRDSYTTVDFGAMTESLVENAMRSAHNTFNLYLSTKVQNITKCDNGFEVQTSKGVMVADYVVVNAGTYSLYLAQKMGLGLDFACLPIAGGFYLANSKILNGKVYMVQNPELPFAALHGDPDLLENNSTRFGPTALFTPTLDYNHGVGGMLDGLRTMNLDLDVLRVLGGLMMKPDVRKFVWKNLLLKIPYIGRRRFLESARKIVPSLQLDQISYAKGFGGIRPQIIDKKNRRLLLGEASVLGEGDLAGIVFNMTPSPGATSSLYNAIQVLYAFSLLTGTPINMERLQSELLAR